MHRSLRYLKSAAKALSKVFARSLANAAGVPEYVVEIPVDLAWEWGEQLHADLSSERSRDEVRRDYQEVIKPGADYSDDELIEAINAGFLGAPESLRMTALALLGQIQSQGRQSLKREEDPSGTTLPAALRFDSVEDHAARLPNALPRYKVGDTPIQGYELAERLGAGGMGEVWKAHNPKRPNLAVALKFFTDARARDWLASHEADVLERVQAEVRHPGIVRLLQVYDDLACLQFEYVRGWTLSRQILDWHTSGPPDPMVIVGEFRRIVEILVDVHDRPVPIVHRDLKPANILVETLPDGKIRYRVTDFGIGGFAADEVVRQTRLGTLGSPRNPSLLRGAHSPLYASDEQKKGRRPDPRDDVFSLGVLWYQMQTGKLDSGPPTGFDWSDDLIEQGMPDGLVRLMASCFSSKADKRPASAKLLVERLDTLLADRAESPKPESAKVRIKPVPPPPRKPEPLPDLIIAKTDDIQLNLIPAGTFLMGSPDGQGHDDEHPQHKVTISRPFYLGIHQVTQGQYAKLMGKNPSHFKGSDDLPVERVSWFDAVRFCNALSTKEGLTPFYRIEKDDVSVSDWNGSGYRLPTEAEWEYASRAGPGGAGAFGFGDAAGQLGSHAWYVDNSERKTHPVGQKVPNARGLFDMHGNVWEWCWDFYANYGSGPVVDPVGPSDGSDRVIRGGSWYDAAESCRAAYRDRDTSDRMSRSLGLRVARVPSGLAR